VEGGCVASDLWCAVIFVNGPYLPVELKYQSMDNPSTICWTVSGQSALESASRGESNGIGFEVSA